MAQYSQNSDSSHFVIYVRYEPSIVVLYIKHNAISNEIGILARPPDDGKSVRIRLMVSPRLRRNQLA
jgi:hypothetical protein